MEGLVDGSGLSELAEIPSTPIKGVTCQQRQNGSPLHFPADVDLDPAD